MKNRVKQIETALLVLLATLMLPGGTADALLALGDHSASPIAQN